ncbi:MAG: hypothetical protein HYR51_01190 [Candidatus Rokubacteria bacterium]|nr:hypothetical protein [Candidatus Rokubacteria bacterium]
MARPIEDLRRRAHLHDPARVHDGGAVGVRGHDAEVVRDEDHGEAAGGLDLLEEVEVLRLDRDVERRRRLVGDEQTRRA